MFCEDRLHVLRAFRDRLFPGNAGVFGAKRRHRLDELINLAVQKDGAIRRMDFLHLVAAPGVPGGHRHLLRASVQLHQEVLSRALEEDIHEVDVDESVADGARRSLERMLAVPRDA